MKSKSKSNQKPRKMYISVIGNRVKKDGGGEEGAFQLTVTHRSIEKKNNRPYLLSTRCLIWAKDNNGPKCVIAQIKPVQNVPLATVKLSINLCA